MLRKNFIAPTYRTWLDAHIKKEAKEKRTTFDLVKHYLISYIVEKMTCNLRDEYFVHLYQSIEVPMALDRYS